MLSSELRQQIDSLWDKFWSNGMPEHMAALKHINYLVFMRYLEDFENVRIIAAKQSKKKYTSIFDGHDEMRWSTWKNYSGEKILPHVRDKVFPFIKNLDVKEGFKLDLKDSNFEINSPILLQEAVQTIEGLKISEQNYDTQGDIYEYIVSKLETSGLNGGFRTPRHIIKMMIEMIDPDVNQKICDPACGTGGFLVNSYLHILKKYNNKESNDADRAVGDKLSDKQREFLLNEQLYGFDYDRSMMQFSQMNMILHGFRRPNVQYQNSVGKQFTQDEEYDVILANPPFSGNLNKSEINEDIDVKTTKTELLFLEVFYNKLVTGGQAAIIVPTGVLFGSSKSNLEIRKTLLEKCQLEAIVYLPSGVFKPYAGVSTAVLIFTKGGSTEKVWLYGMEHDGFSLDDKRKPVKENDIEDILKQYQKRGKSKFLHNGEFKSLSITIDDIKENDYNLSVNRYIDNSVPEEQIDIQEEANKLEDLKKDRKSSEEQMIKDLEELGFKV